MSNKVIMLTPSEYLCFLSMGRKLGLMRDVRNAKYCLALIGPRRFHGAIESSHRETFKTVYKSGEKRGVGLWSQRRKKTWDSTSYGILAHQKNHLGGNRGAFIISRGLNRAVNEGLSLREKTSRKIKHTRRGGNSYRTIPLPK